MSAPQLRTATSEDTQSIRVLLENNGLPTRDLVSSKPQFIVACEGQAIVAAGALQRFASSALLRSVAVAPHRRGTGLGRILVEELERIARAARITELILLTHTAKAFFEHQGYRVIERHEVPQDVQGSEEFRSLCPASAACMAKALTGASWRDL
jgi:N-acetylglutamate synthase-like GNAT family acetyltransferase